MLSYEIIMLQKGNVHIIYASLPPPPPLQKMDKYIVISYSTISLPTYFTLKYSYVSLPGQILNITAILFLLAVSEFNKLTDITSYDDALCYL